MRSKKVRMLCLWFGNEREKVRRVRFRHMSRDNIRPEIGVEAV
jgi:hypothetical protein